MKLVFGAMQSKQDAHKEGLRQRKVVRAMQAMRNAIVLHSKGDDSAVLGKRCGHCGNWPWEEHDWVCPPQYWNVSPHGITKDVLAEAARRVLQETKHV